MGVPKTLPANFSGWDKGPPQTLPANFDQWDKPEAQPIGQPSAEDEASNTRQMLVSGLTGMPTPNMTEADKQSFYRGKAAGAVSVPIVAAATIGGTEAGGGCLHSMTPQ